LRQRLVARGVQSFGDARCKCRILCPPVEFKSFVEESEKCRHLKYLKTSFDKKQISKNYVKNISKRPGGFYFFICLYDLFRLMVHITMAIK